MIIPKEKRPGDRSTRRSRSRKSRSSIAKASSPPANVTTRSSTSGRTARDQISNVMFQTLEHNQGKKEYNPVYLMVDSGARGNRQQVASSPVCAASWPSLAATSSRSPILVELPRRSDGARILHLDARRAQRSGRHRAQDRGLRLHDAQTRGRVAGRDHPRGGLRHDQRHLGSGHLRRRRRSRQAERAHRRSLLLRRHRESGRQEEGMS